VPSGTLNVGVPGQPQSLDPSMDVENFDLPIVTALYDGLVQREPQTFSKLSPALATSWTTTHNARVWTFKLRRGVTFSDGAPFNSAAAAKSLKYYARPTASLSFAVGPSPQITTPGPYTIVLTYKQPFPDLGRYLVFVKMISPTLLAGPLATVEKRISTEAAGTGPYVLKSFSSSGVVAATANPHYWGGGPHVANLNFQPFSQESSEVSGLEAGGIGLVMGLSPRAAQSLASDSQIRETSVPSTTTYIMSLPTQQAPFNNVLVRRALAYAINPQALASAVMLGEATLSYSSLPTTSYGYHKPSTTYSYNPARAKALLQQAGIHTPVSVSMDTFGNLPAGEQLCQAVAGEASSAGFTISCAQVSAAVGNADQYKKHRRWEIVMSATGYVSASDLHLAGGFITQRSNFHDATLDRLIAGMNSTPDGPAREAIIGHAQEVLAEQLPEIPLFQVKDTDAFTTALQNHVPTPDGYFLPNWSQQYLTP
jgi:peptide/nickel transport system substrate-binding protein